MFDNLHWSELLGLLVLAFLIFGERLPKVIGDGLRMLRNLRRMATDATSDLSRELGTDISLDDLNPKSLLRKHLLSEDDERALRRPLEDLAADLRGQVQDVRGTVEQTRDGVRDAVDASRGTRRDVASRPQQAEVSADGGTALGPAEAPARPRFDDAT